MHPRHNRETHRSEKPSRRRAKNDLLIDYKGETER
jgi:hypothetical protein